jgi:hypothetical protein
MKIYEHKYNKYKSKYIKAKYYNSNLIGRGVDGCDFENSIIFHAFHMRFNDICKMIDNNELDNYDYIQTSPIQECRKNMGKLLIDMKRDEVNISGLDLIYEEPYDNDGMLKECKSPVWFLQYQPISTKIGNYYGTKDEFLIFIKKAHDHDIKVIVDVVLNHMAGLTNIEQKVWNSYLTQCINGEFPIKHDDLKDKFSDLQATFKTCYDHIKNKNIKLNNHLTFDENDVEYTENKPLTVDILTDRLIKKLSYYFDTKSYKSSNMKNFLYLLDTITIPFSCSHANNGTYKAYHSIRCWLGQSMPQLNYNHPLVSNIIDTFLKNLHDCGVSGIRVDMGGHMPLNHAHAIEKKWHSFSDNSIKKFSYFEVLDMHSYFEKPINTVKDYSDAFRITEQQLMYYLKKIFENKSESLHNLIFIPHKIEDWTIINNDKNISYTATHDSKQPESEIGGGFNDYTCEILALCFLIQKLCSTTLVYKNQGFHPFVIKTLKFRKFLFKSSNKLREKNIIFDNIFISNKYYGNKWLGSFYLNIYENDKIIVDTHGVKIKINAKNIFVRMCKD